ncbi:MAG TPA: phosphatase PAP2 family protein [Gemmatimonadales bacterium]|nr:phosphatase PAP2 family protein [Gemmatimonadales bacterium]
MLHRVTARDHRWMDALARREAPPWMDRVLRAVTHGGDATITIGLTLLLLAFPGTRHLGCVAGVANLFSHLLVQALKRTVVRPRPTAMLPHVTALANIPDHFSFPSGHACASMALAMATVLITPAAGTLALLLAFLIGASRVYLRVHYVTDVVVGQALGAATAVVVYVTLA